MATKGGARPGAGRKRGVPNKKTAEKLEQIAQSGLTPLDYMLQVMRNPETPEPLKLDAAKSAAPYVHPRLANVELANKNNEPFKIQLAGSDGDL